ncbi:hypothetical protein F0562_012466 [Nyssa sinensis]|uniref:RRM domain-containing protein n=1 Tax=Nyssa sinensis TaxID=561372 RepID=A0A5J4ZSM0_9ASTE|nr:hypothetical protein F0562_012466 [Nyssa sinensis]
MRNHLNLGDAKPEEVSEDTVRAVAETLRNSSFLKVSEDGELLEEVGRTTELLKPEEVIEQLDVRTIAASPLEYDVKLEDVKSFFGQFAKVNSIGLPRNVADKKLFYGTSLIEFSTEEDAEKVLKQSLVYDGVELELKPKKDFDAERAKQVDKVENPHSQVGSNYKNSSNAEANYPKGLIVAFTLKSMSTGGSVEQNGSHDSASDNVDVQKTDGGPDSTENVSEEAEQKVSNDIKDNDEEPGENVEENKEKANAKSGRFSKKLARLSTLTSRLEQIQDTFRFEEPGAPQESTCCLCACRGRWSGCEKLHFCFRACNWCFFFFWVPPWGVVECSMMMSIMLCAVWKNLFLVFVYWVLPLGMTGSNKCMAVLD